MNSESRQWATVGVSALALVVIGGLSGLSGCNSHRDQLRPENLFEQIGRQRGQLIEPRKCVLRVAIVDRPFRDPSINEIVWKTADEQTITPEARRALQVNGLRIGRITGEFPPELEAVLAAPPPHKVEPATFLLDDGEQTLISINEAADQVTAAPEPGEPPLRQGLPGRQRLLPRDRRPRRCERCLASLHARDPSRASAALVPAHSELRSPTLLSSSRSTTASRRSHFPTSPPTSSSKPARWP